MGVKCHILVSAPQTQSARTWICSVLSHREESDVKGGDVPIPALTVVSIDHNAMQPQDTFCF